MTPTPYTAPNFSLLASDGTIKSLNDFAGSWLVLYFYPKDDTPGCTAQACSIRDARDELTKLGANVVGVSRDDASSHDTFKAKYDLNFVLLSDPNHKAMEAYGAWGQKMFGQEGVLRKTFIIDPNGQVQKVFGRAMPVGHGDAVIAALKAVL